MNKIVDFFNKWAFAMMICLAIIALLFALGSCIYTAIINPFVGIVGGIGVLIALAIAVGWLFAEIKKG